MRCRVILCAALAIAACRAAPESRTDQAAVDVQTGATASYEVSLDSVAQFLLTAAATDFHAHQPPDPVRFRDVRLGHMMTPAGEKQYILCGQFLPAQEGGRADWVPFATIKTSPYEQWTGGQAAGLCQSSSVTWDEVPDLTSALQSRRDSLR